MLFFDRITLVARRFLEVILVGSFILTVSGSEALGESSVPASRNVATGAAAEIRGDVANFQWEFSVRDPAGKAIRTARMKAEGTAVLRDRNRGSCLYKFIRKEKVRDGKFKYHVEETCAVEEIQARGNATVSSTNSYACLAAAESFDAEGKQSCATTVDTRTGKQFYCECKLSVQSIQKKEQ